MTIEQTSVDPGAEEQPAVFVNRFQVSPFPIGVRIAMAEQMQKDGEPHYRGAIFVSLADAKALGELLMHMTGTKPEQH